MERALQALVLSQYRLKVFQDHRLSIKPVVLFKAAKIADSKDFMAKFIEAVKKLTGAQLQNLSNATDNEVMHRAFAYFVAKTKNQLCKPYMKQSFMFLEKLRNPFLVSKKPTEAPRNSVQEMFGMSSVIKLSTTQIRMMAVLAYLKMTLL